MFSFSKQVLYYFFFMLTASFLHPSWKSDLTKEREVKLLDAQLWKGSAGNQLECSQISAVCFQLGKGCLMGNGKRRLPEYLLQIGGLFQTVSSL